MMRTAPLVLAVAALLLTSSPALAQAPRLQQSPPVLEDAALRPGAIVFNLGFASAVGELGFAYTRQLDENFELEGGAGLGWTGLQLSVMPKLVFGSAHDRFITGAGFSVGAPGAKLSHGGHEVVVWLNVDAVGYEHRARGGFVFTVAAGFTTSLSRGITEAIDENNGGSVNLAGYTLPQLRFGFGFSI